MIYSYLLTTKNDTKYKNFKLQNGKKKQKIGVGKTNGAFCKQGGPPHNTIGLKYKSIQKLVHCFSSILCIPKGFHKECHTQTKCKAKLDRKT